jgi:hypothetical protein
MGPTLSQLSLASDKPAFDLNTKRRGGQQENGLGVAEISEWRIFWVEWLGSRTESKNQEAARSQEAENGWDLLAEDF